MLFSMALFGFNQPLSLCAAMAFCPIHPLITLPGFPVTHPPSLNDAPRFLLVATS